MDSMAIKCFKHIAQHNQLRAGVHVHVEHHIVLPCVHTKRNGGQHNYFCPMFVCQPRCLGAMCSASMMSVP